VDLKISVVSPSLNQGRYIEDAIQSVARQDYPCFEHIVIDGGSTDATRSILEKHAHLRWVSEPDEGQTAALNKGIRLSSGQVLGWLNTDDVYRPGAFWTVARVFQQDPTTAMVVGNCDEIDEESRVTGCFRARLDQYEDMLRYWEWGSTFCIPQAAVFLRMDLLAEIGEFNERYDLAMDYEMWLRVAARYPLTFVDRTLAAFRTTADTKTSRRRLEMDWEQFCASARYWRLARGLHRAVIPVQSAPRGLLAALRKQRRGRAR
jgi:glycosyltransferase involved in cell wall biosynthesis